MTDPVIHARRPCADGVERACIIDERRSRQDRERLAEDGLHRWCRPVPTLLDDPECTARLLLFEPHGGQPAQGHFGFVPALARVVLPLGRLLFDVFTSEVAFGRKCVMRTALDRQVCRIIGASKRARISVIELEERARFTTPARFVDGGTLRRRSFRACGGRSRRATSRRTANPAAAPQPHRDKPASAREGRALGQRAHGDPRAALGSIDRRAS